MDKITVSAKTVEDAITKAAIELETSSDRLEVEVVEKGSSGLLGIIGSKPAVIRVSVKEDLIDSVEKKQEQTEKLSPSESELIEQTTTDLSTEPDAEKSMEMAKDFLKKMFDAMDMKVDIQTSFDEKEKELLINMEGENMGILIGKRGQTLDSLQYLVSLIVNKQKEGYIRVKLDTENYRSRRKETLEILAKNISYKVKRTKHPVALEPMNPYERRIIHAALQNDRYVVTRSEGEEPFRHVIISLKK